LSLNLYVQKNEEIVDNLLSVKGSITMSNDLLYIRKDGDSSW